MVKIRHYYLIQLQFLGFRYSGWQKQPNQKTIEHMLIKTLKFILPSVKFKILGAGRTDSKVSALDAKFELFIDEHPILDFDNFMSEFNANLPPDIKAVAITEVDAEFNVIQNSKSKEYVYLFAFGQKNHPFCAPFLANIIQDLDIELMKEGALLFEGIHHFKAYTARPQENTQFVRTITNCEIKENTILSANFFPKKSYALYVEGEGFIRYQVRMIMGALILLGKGELSIEEIKSSLKEHYPEQISYVAPGSGLLLHRLDFEEIN
ncbi:MAG: tRNA pseudouridine(38-40) synthase TruA [Flavobacteriaceae bacterium]|nr:MAG: tRNA pseudouridine(38-40) synthase TruA [Flavobacteriaceae bacterium]